MIVEKQKENFWMLNWLDQYMIGHSGFIAGGCFKNIFNKERVKDIDIFFRSMSEWNDAVHYFDRMTHGYEGSDKMEEDYFFHYENSKVKAYRNTKSGIIVELCKSVFGEAKDVISQFDFTIAKFAYYKAEVKDDTGTHTEYRIVCDDNFFEHLHLHRLVVDDKIPFPMSTFERMIRYIGYGYRPCKETKIKIASAICELPEQDIRVGESLYDGMD